MGRSSKSIKELTIELSQAPERPKICARCSYVFEYPKEAPWSQAFQLVCEHWKTCLAEAGGAVPPSDLKEEVIERGRASPTPSETSEGTPVATGKRRRESSRSSTGPARRRKKNIMDKGTRRQLIENDAWAKDATAKTVGCKGCGRTIKLDKRSDYYPGLWLKHRNKCLGIRRIEGKAKKIKSGRNARSSEIEWKDTKTRSSRVDEASAAEGLPKKSPGASITTKSSSVDLRYDAGSSVAGGSSRSETPEDRTSSYREMTTPQGQKDSSARSSRGESLPVGGAVSRHFDYSEDEEYWAGAPFGPATAKMEELARGRRLYRYSTRWELATNYRGTTIPDKEAEGPWSEDVMQAARCLVSLKRRL